ncbi:hypothetical protein [Photobacterium atrarenae]|uniref:Uncharacterized protein n=1 Tax=Photobacterium atrarenae TaxID=865757 RepID=A0ABY5GLW9_9GAMM|nr:hypothetical protein [Photobacterium atrarenae]UTV30319.1 hypothetical protein NNL38_17220 [Photobacterium atrarenae]
MTDSHLYDADLELQHLYLEVHAERFHYLEMYLEGYYCYRHQLVTRQGKADWTQIFDYAQRSLAAQRVPDRKQLVRLFRLPLSALTGKLKTLIRDDALTYASLAQCLDEHLDYVILTRAEWQQLKAAGLENRMPAGYYQPGTVHYQQTMARFQALSIAF